MFKHIKLTTVSRLFAALMLFTCIVLGLGTVFLERNIVLIGSSWQQFQTDRSEKARLESTLRSAIGYGGMIHEFKNYVLRQEVERVNHVQSDIGAARAVLNQYHAQDLSVAETVALDDIASMLGFYEKAASHTRQLVAEGKSSNEIDQMVRVDDTPALRGLQTLRQVVREKHARDVPLSKGRLIADLRAAIGYGGMIHEFKNYVLRHEPERVGKVKDKLQQARRAIDQYRGLGISRAEAIALDDVESTLVQYGNRLETVSKMIANGAASPVIDIAVKINDEPALRGLLVLDREISRQVAERSSAVSQALEIVDQMLGLSTTVVILLILLVVFTTSWLMSQHFMKPVLRLTDGMKKLAANDLSVTFDQDYRDNELGEMARAVMVFRENMIERERAEQQLAAANEEMNERINVIHKLREDAQQQASKALDLADGMVAARESAEQERMHVAAVLNAVRDAIITINTKGIIESVNPGAEMLFGYRADEMLNKNVSMIVYDETERREHDAFLERFLAGHSQRDMSKPIEQRARRKDGSLVVVEITLNTMTIAGELKIMGVVRDITERKHAEEKIKQLAMTDPLTGLANRNQYALRLKEAAVLSNRLNEPFALMLIDLDKFKPVNDTYGHPVGDVLLEHVAQTLVDCCRDTDTVARLGGDEFAIILSASDHFDVHIPAQRIVERLARPVEIQGHTVNIGTSVGISIYPKQADNLKLLQIQADEALYRAKQEGRGRYCVYQADAETPPLSNMK